LVNLYPGVALGWYVAALSGLKKNVYTCRPNPYVHMGLEYFMFTFIDFALKSCKKTVHL